MIYFYLIIIIYSNQDSLSSVSLTNEDIPSDNVVKQDQTAASCSDYKIKYVNTTSEESNISSYFKTDLLPDVQIMKGIIISLLIK